MALIDFKFFSTTLRMHTEANIIIPQRNTKGEIGILSKAEPGKYKCLYLLHGLSDDYSNWLRRTSIERYAAQYGICVVMPTVARSFYTDMKYGLNYFTFITEELPEIIGEFFNVSTAREDSYIAGLSMGGYGALKAALRKPEKYCAAAGLSSVADIRNRKKDGVLIPVFGDEYNIPDDEDLFCLAEKTNSSPLKPRIFMGCGTEDKLYDANIRLKEHIEKLDYDLTFRESEGRHSWVFWDEYIQHTLEWMFG